ncbi:MAG: hypothetical protein WHT27_00520 [candidate division WOR-3 bacterium]
MKSKSFLIKISFLIGGILLFVIGISIARFGVLIAEIFIFSGILIIIVGIISGFWQDRKKKRKRRKFFEVDGVDLLFLGFILFLVSIGLVNLSFRKNPFTLIIYLIGYLGIFLIVFGVFKIVYRIVKRFRK